MSDRDRPAPPFHVPDLELEPAVPKRPAPKPVRAAPAPASREATRGPELDIEAGPGVTLSTGSAGGASQSFGL
ncbi:MAG TPA: hypothetical protein VIW29_09170, partial [Polyangiaceae bacterium]